jgi:hypothetical protein
VRRCSALAKNRKDKDWLGNEVTPASFGRLIAAQRMLELRRQWEPNSVPVNARLKRLYERLGLDAEAARAAKRVKLAMPRPKHLTPGHLDLADGIHDRIEGQQCGCVTCLIFAHGLQDLEIFPFA